MGCREERIKERKRNMTVQELTDIINEEKDRRGVGYISAHSYFDKLLNDPQLTSILHLP